MRKRECTQAKWMECALCELHFALPFALPLTLMRGNAWCERAGLTVCMRLKGLVLQTALAQPAMQRLDRVHGREWYAYVQGGKAGCSSCCPLRGRLSKVASISRCSC